MRQSGKIFWLIAAVVAVFAMAPGHSAQAVTCLPPTKINAYVNPFTGEIDFNWVPGGPTKTFYLDVKVAGPGVDCYNGAAIKSFTIDGGANFYKIDSSVLNGGKYLYCLRAECCNDRCDSCVVPPKDDYCAYMAAHYTDSCACSDPAYPVARTGSFVYKCADGSQSPTPCPPSTKTVGCDWQCAQATSANTLSCGSTYEVKCGQGPNKQLVTQKPSYNLCAVNDGRGFKMDDSYLVKPPGVTDDQNPLFGYQWDCLGGNDNSCVACRRAVCGNLYQGSILSDVKNSNDLCRDSDGVITGQAANFQYNDAKKQWTWDCVGRDDCNQANGLLANRNWVYRQYDWQVSGWEQVNACSALKAGCGEADKNFYVWDNFSAKADGQIGFLCLNGGLAVADKDWRVTQTNPLTGITTDVVKWQCAYPTQNKDLVNCQARIIDCQSQTKGKALTLTNWQTNYYPDNNKLCQNGLNNDFQEGAVDKDLNKPEWRCQDKWGGSQICSDYLVDCAKPPHESFVDSFHDLQTLGVCSYGTAVNWRRTQPKGWPAYWDCQDDDGYLVKSCWADHLTCAKPPHNGSYVDLAALEAANPNVSCAGAGPYQCTGLCSDPTRQIDLSYDAAKKQWSWQCGVEACSAKLLDCAQPPANTYFGNISEFKAYVMSIGGNCSAVSDTQLNCFGVCTDNKYDPQHTGSGVTVTLTNHKFTWDCGKTCTALEAGCGNWHGLGPQPADKFIAAQPGPDENFCLNNGQVVWYDKYPLAVKASQGLGFTPYVAENPLINGSWRWQCSYPAIDGGNFVKPADVFDSQPPAYQDEANKNYYCYNWEEGQCRQLADNMTFTVDQLQAVSNNSSRGNRWDENGKAQANDNYLCARGVVQKLDGQGPIDKDRNQGEFVNNFSRLSDKSYVYWCEGGMKNAGLWDICKLTAKNILGCQQPPDGGTYQSDQAFDAAYAAGACEGNLTPGNKVFDQAACQWTWECAGDSCSAKKNGVFNIKNISGQDNFCARDSAVYEIKAADIEGCDPAEVTVSWSVSGVAPTADPAPAISGSGWSLTVPAGLASGDYLITAIATCGQTACVQNATVTQTKQVKIEDKTQNSSLTPTDEQTICARQNITYKVATDPFCQNPVYTWTNCNSNGATCGKTYNTSGDYAAGDVSVTVTCDGCYRPWTGLSPRVTVEQSEDPTGVTLEPSDLSWCREDRSAHSLTAEARFSDADTPDCQNLQYSWQVDGKDVGGVSATLDLDALGLTNGQHGVTVKAMCQDKCSEKKAVTASAVVKIKEVKAGAIGQDHNICTGKTPALLTNIQDAVGADSLDWEMSADTDGDGICDSAWTGLGVNQSTYQPPALTATTCYRRVAKSANPDCGDKYSNTVTIKVAPLADQSSSLTPDGEQNLCAGQSVTYSVKADPFCQNPVYTWTNCNSNGATCGKTYNTPGDYAAGDVSVTITCGGCYKPWTGLSPRVTVKAKPTATPGQVQIDPNPTCSKLAAALQIAGAACSDGSTPTYEWYENNKALSETGDSLSVSKTVSAPTVFDYYVKVTCGQGSCSNTAVTKATKLTVNPEPAAGNIKQDQAVCSGKTVAKLVTDTAAPKNYDKLQWQRATLDDKGNCLDDWADVNGAASETYTPDQSDRGYCYRRLAKQTGCADDISNVVKISVKPSKAVPDKVDLKLDDELCQGDVESANLFYKAVFTEEPTSVKCSKLEFALTITYPDGSVAEQSNTADNYDYANSSATLSFAPSQIGKYSIKVKFRCLDECADPEGWSRDFIKELSVYDCSCGSADGKNFVDNDSDKNIDKLGTFRYCNDGCSAVPTPPSFTNGQWSWRCQCGKNLTSPDCKAGLAACGEEVVKYVYTDSTWQSNKRPALCINGASRDIFQPWGSEPKPSAYGRYSGIEDANKCIEEPYTMWQWQCVDSVGSRSNTCAVKRQDCGIADAYNLLRNAQNDSKECRIQPYDDPNADGYRASYDKNSGVPSSHKCAWGAKYAINFTDTQRGKWSWNCEDDFGGVVNCEARQDCGWDVRSSTVRYPTVNYGDAGCWTAADVGTYNNDDVKNMNWGKATRIPLSVSDTSACANDNNLSYWSACKGLHCSRNSWFELEGSCVNVGVCAGQNGFSLPTDDNWHALETKLANGNACNGARLNDDGSCAPSGNDDDGGAIDDPSDDGLLDPVTFAGSLNAGYWTNSQKAQPRNTAFCYGTSCPLTLPYYKIVSDDQVSRRADSGNDQGTTGPEHLVRCYKQVTPTPIVRPPGAPCVGFGCYGL